ncbi:MAG: hypothetical protein ABS80_18025 [Pseudonocardia sp. SCN 72-51]|nr:MAG: hypothetical protein ABS80_18025 [Pseudonocardia sp. SCN 72-51]
MTGIRYEKHLAGLPRRRVDGISELDVAMQHQQCRLAWTFVLTESVSGDDANQQVMQALALVDGLDVAARGGVFRAREMCYATSGERKRLIRLCWHDRLPRQVEVA